MDTNVTDVTIATVTSMCRKVDGGCLNAKTAFSITYNDKSTINLVNGQSQNNSLLENIFFNVT